MSSSYIAKKEDSYTITDLDLDCPPNICQVFVPKRQNSIGGDSYKGISVLQIPQIKDKMVIECRRSENNELFFSLQMTGVGSGVGVGGTSGLQKPARKQNMIHEIQKKNLNICLLCAQTKMVDEAYNLESNAAEPSTTLQSSISFPIPLGFALLYQP